MSRSFLQKETFDSDDEIDLCQAPAPDKDGKAAENQLSEGRHSR